MPRHPLLLLSPGRYAKIAENLRKVFRQNCDNYFGQGHCADPDFFPRTCGSFAGHLWLAGYSRRRAAARVKVRQPSRSSIQPTAA